MMKSTPPSDIAAPTASARTVTRYSMIDGVRVIALAELLLSQGGIDSDACNDFRGLIGNYAERAVPASEVDPLLATLVALERKHETLRNAWQTSEKDRVATLTALAAQAQAIERLRELSDEDIARIIDGIEQFIMNGDPEVDAIWQPYVDRLAALRAVPQTEPTK